MILRNKDKAALVAIFATVNLPIEVWAYGSRVSGEAHEGSDLDLVIRSRNLDKLPLDVLLELKERIQESNIPIVVELFDWARLPRSFHKKIEARHEVLFSNMSLKVNEPQTEYKSLNSDSNDLLDNNKSGKTKSNQSSSHKNHGADK